MSPISGQASPHSSNSDFWSASDHSSLTGSFHSWPSSEAEDVQSAVDIDLLSLETLSISDDASESSTATPTFSDLPGIAPEGVESGR